MMSARRLLLVAGAMLLTASTGLGMRAAAAGPARSPGWTVMPSPNAQPPEDQLSAVSCSSATACAAVGQYQTDPTTGTTRTLAKVWADGTWALRGAPDLANSHLSAVACSAASACVAVGQAGSEPLAEAWNGSTWVSLMLPQTGGTLLGVSCAAATACMAVGEGGRFGATLAEWWNGSVWTILPTPAVGGTGSQLNSVSCSTAASCTAVGSIDAGSEGDTLVPLAERWNGSAWSVQALPAAGEYLTSVSCPSAASCTAVGYDGGFLAEHWNGSRWAVQSVHSAGRLLGYPPGAVSCPAGTSCTAVAGPYVLRWKGSKWAIQLRTRTAVSYFSGVSCTSEAACTAVGQVANRRLGGQVTLAERWDGRAWAVESTPGNPVSTVPDDVLTGVSCPAAGACMAVGDFSPSPWTLAEAWNGRRWAIRRPVNPAGDDAALSGVSCWSASRCVAVGDYFSYHQRTQRTLAEFWNGQTWVIMRARQPMTTVGSNWRSLTAVSCTSRRACLAIGTFKDRPLAEHWNGRKWTVQPTPRLRKPSALLRGLSCPTARQCLAVGSYNSHAFAEAWRDGRWAVTPTPGGGDLTSVSCNSARTCIAVGSYFDRAVGAVLPLAERWNGRSWSDLHAANPPAAPGSATGSVLDGVSCPAARVCVAVGESGDGTVLAETWNGERWTIRLSTGAGTLSAVSCPSATLCSAVGVNDGTLVEHYS